MSDPAPHPEPPPEGRGRNPILAVLMLLVGLILLLPGLCSIIVMGFAASNPRQLVDSGVLGWLGALWLVCFLISAGGIALLRRAFR